MNLLTYDLSAIMPPGKCGEAEIVHDEPSQLERLRGAWGGQSLDRDRYVRLLYKGQLLMGDMEDERRTNLLVVSKARGDVLVFGLGIGLIIVPILAKPSVTSVTVIEKNADVIALVAGRLARPKLRVLHGDLFNWMPPAPKRYKGQRFDVIYSDIWGDISTDDLETARTLNKSLRRALKPGGWIGSWPQEFFKLHGRRW